MAGMLGGGSKKSKTTTIVFSRTLDPKDHPKVTAVADDPSAIFFNPAGLGWQKHFEAEIGSSFLTKVKGDFEGQNPFPGVGVSEDQHKTTFVLPTLYMVAPLTNELNFGLGIYSPYGLGYRWDNPDTFTGRFISQNAVIQSVDLNSVFSY